MQIGFRLFSNKDNRSSVATIVSKQREHVGLDNVLIVLKER